MSTTSWAGKDANGNPISFNAEQPNPGGPLTAHFVLEIAGNPVAGAVPVADAAAEASLATIAASFATAANQETAIASLAIIAAGTPSGVGGAGISQPAGGTGIQGWLSGCFQALGDIYTKLSGTLTATLAAGTNAIGSVTVSNFPATQPVSGAVALAAGSAAIGTVGVTALPSLPAGTNTIGAVVSPSGSGTDASGAPPATLSLLETMTVVTPGAYYVQNQSAAPIQVELDNGTSGGTIILLSSGGSAGSQGSDTAPALPWFVGRIRVFGAAGAQFAARSN
jgi:hypothetical protein